MQKYKQAIASITFLTIIMTSGLYTYGSQSQNRSRTVSNNDDESAQETILQTFEDGDYERWRQEVGRKGEIADLVSKSEFEIFVYARQLARSGHYDEAFEISSRLEEHLMEKLELA